MKQNWKKREWQLTNTQSDLHSIHTNTHTVMVIIISWRCQDKSQRLDGSLRGFLLLFKSEIFIENVLLKMYKKKREFKIKYVLWSYNHSVVRDNKEVNYFEMRVCLFRENERERELRNKWVWMYGVCGMLNGN